MKQLGMNYWRAGYSESCTVSSAGGRGKRNKQLIPRQRPTRLLKVAVEQPKLDPLRLKLDPGSKTTGLAVVNDTTGEVVFAAELTHRGHLIKERMDARRALRRGRRQRHTRYRKPRCANRRRQRGWLPPSLESRLANTLTWTHRLIRLCPITAISQELVKFDLQAMDNPEIEGREVRRVTRYGIPGTTRKNLRGGSWVIQLT